MRAILIPCSWLYGLVMLVRNILFDLGVLRSRAAGVPVIAVGNMTAGGTGKTPLVEYLAGDLVARGYRVGVVSRGYGRHSRGVVVVSDGQKILATAGEGGDEAVQVAKKIPQAVVVVAERRVEGARRAVQDLGARVLVLDDAFQHRYLRRDLDIVVLDARFPIRREPMLPAGRRREPLNGLRRAGLVAYSKLPAGRTGVEWSGTINALTSAPQVAYRTVPGTVRRVRDGNVVPGEALRSVSVMALSGLADNARFVEDVRSTGASVVAALGFADHHRYTAADVETMLSTFRASGASLVVTTEKDLPRLEDGPGRKLLEMAEVTVLPVVVQWVTGEGVLRGAVTGILNTAGTP